ncbi:hypothetical protein Bbelb_145760 [Branchiostoma belcheri]|nr:hypothetical protein Bbelb_145760 [Branchiostoma belcheri]
MYRDLWRQRQSSGGLHAQMVIRDPVPVIKSRTERLLVYGAFRGAPVNAIQEGRQMMHRCTDRPIIRLKSRLSRAPAQNDSGDAGFCFRCSSKLFRKASLLWNHHRFRQTSPRGPVMSVTPSYTRGSRVKCLSQGHNVVTRSARLMLINDNLEILRFEHVAPEAVSMGSGWSKCGRKPGYVGLGITKMAASAGEQIRTILI